jgi:hypothetical protein
MPPSRLELLGSAKARAALLWLLLLAAAVFFLWPALRPVHVEGFSASIVALGLHMSQGAVRDFMPFAPFNADYFGLTKLGAVDGVAALSPFVGGEGAMRVEMWAGAALCLGASAWLIRRWTDASWLIIGAVLLFFPGVAESFFFFNDNVPAAGLMLLALALWAWRPSLPIAVLAGALIGYAVAIRTDTVLVAATAMPLVALETRGLWRATLMTAVAGVVAIVVLVALFALAHATPIDALRAGVIAVKLWDRPSDFVRHALIVIYFLGAPALLLLFIGTVGFVQERHWLRLALAAGVPLFVNLVLMGKMWEVRQLLVLSPFLGALAAKGIGFLIASLRDHRPVAPLFVAGITIAWLFSPAAGIVASDGPRALSGRVAGLLLWNEWQQSVRSDFQHIDDAVALAPPNGVLAVLTDGWNDDRYLHLELVKQGFRRSPSPQPCSAIGEAMTANGRTVVELSIRQTFLPTFPALDGQRFEHYAMPCLAAIHPARTILLADSERLDEIYGKADRERGLDPRLVKATRGRIIAVPLDNAALGVLDQAYRKEAQAFGGQFSAENAMAMTQSQTEFSR